MTRTVFVTVTDQSGAPVDSAIVIAVLDRYDIETATGEWVSPAQYQYRTDENGEVTMSLWPNEAGERGSRYRVTAMTAGGRILFDVLADVPDVDGSLLSEISEQIAIDGGAVIETGPIDQLEVQRLIEQFFINYSRVAGIDVALDDYGAHTVKQSEEGKILRATGAEPPISPETETLLPVYLGALENGTIVDLIHRDEPFAVVVIIAEDGVELISGLSGSPAEVLMLTGQNKRARLHWISPGVVHVDGGIADAPGIIPMKLVSAEVPSSGDEVVLTFSNPVVSSSPGDGFVLARSLAGIEDVEVLSIAAASIGGAGGNQITLDVGQIYQGDTLLISYNASAGDISGAGLQFRTVTGRDVQNDSTVPAPLPTDKDNLLAAINSVAPLDALNYTTASWGVLTDAVLAGNDVYSDVMATQAEVDAAAEAITDAIGDLVPLADKSGLASALAEAGLLDEQVYTPESWAPLSSAVVAGNAVMVDEDASQIDIGAAATAILDAIGNLEEAPVSCSITLTGDIAAAFGGQPMTISGQTASYTLTETPTLWIASTPIESMYPRPSTGVSIFEVVVQQSGAEASPIGGMADTSHVLGFSKSASGQNVILMDASTFAVIAHSAPISSEAVVGFGLSASGPAAFVDGEPVDLVDAQTSSPYSLSGIFQGGAALLAIGDGSSAGTSGGVVTFVTHGEDFQSEYPRDIGVTDWCGAENVPLVPLPYIIAGHYTQEIGGDTLELTGYAASPSIGSLSGIPLDGATMTQLGLETINGVEFRRGAQFSGDATSALAGKSIYIDGVVYPITSVNYSAVSSYTEVLIPTLPTFVDGATYTVEFK